VHQDLVARVDLDAVEVDVRMEVVVRRLEVDRARDLDPTAHHEPRTGSGDANSCDHPTHTIHHVDPGKR
jgi:hypothetical protein